jgi:transposase-like protein
MLKCPHCEIETLTKAGFNQSGSQRYRCKVCKRYTTPAPNLNGFPADAHEQALKLYLEGNGLRGTGRLLHMVHQTVANWMNTAHTVTQVRSPAYDLCGDGVR